MMRTTLYVDKRLLEEAMRLANTNKKTEAVNLALIHFVRKRRIEKLVSRLGAGDFSLSHEGLEEMRRDE